MPEPSDDGMPEWKRQSVERSLQAARARAQERSDRFVAAAIELMQERGTVDFTVQDVVDRSRMSIRTFYKFFASKDDLLVAVHETVLAEEVTARLRKRCADERDPVRRVWAYIEGMYELTADPMPVSRALTVYRNRLAETRPDEVDRAFRPQIDLVVELVREATASCRPPRALSPETAAHLLHHTVLAAVHARILAADQSTGVSAEELWAFCASGIGVEPTAEGRP
ncbi:MAG TPA: TetR/AcrR family transcriptional regulator [Acidimicrobiales bacterium]|nr:TetR/AcrR family transcriptional regulator [Acidimicrobiales bacterium]